jgi:CheY-like chemotaxis protein
MALDALRVIDSSKPRAVVLDLALPRLNGREVLAELRANVATQHIPVVIVTGNDDSDLDPTQFACVLRKPISPDQLAEAVEKCVSRLGLRASTSSDDSSRSRPRREDV